MAYGYDVSGSELSSALRKCESTLRTVNVSSFAKLPDISAWSGTNINQKINEAIKKVETQKKSLEGQIGSLIGIANLIQEYQDVRAKLEQKKSQRSSARANLNSMIHNHKKGTSYPSAYYSTQSKLRTLSDEINTLEEKEKSLKSSLSGAGYPPRG